MNLIPVVCTVKMVDCGVNTAANNNLARGRGSLRPSPSPRFSSILNLSTGRPLVKLVKLVVKLEIKRGRVEKKSCKYEL